MPNLGLMVRQGLRLFRTQSPLIRGLSLANALLLVLGAVTVGVRLGSDDDGPKTGVEFVGRGDEDPEPGEEASATTIPGETTTTEAGAPTTTARRRSGGTSTGGTTGGTTGGGGGGTTKTDECATGPLTASDKGVSDKTIKVVLPWFDPAAAFALAGGQEETPENHENIARAMVRAFNEEGICGRTLDAKIVEFNPLNEADMEAKCREWTEQDKVFAVIDSAAWHSHYQSCIAEDHDTPLISEWVTVPSQAEAAAPYLWWVAPDSNQTIVNWVLWAKEAGVVNASTKIGVVAADRPGDNAALRVMEDALQRANLTLTHKSQVAFDPATAQAQIPIEISRMRDKGVQVVFPLLPFTTYAFWLNQVEAQWDSPGGWRPKTLVGDYESTILVAEAVLGNAFPKSLNKAPGPSFIKLGEPERRRHPEGYTAAERRCNDMWKKYAPNAENLEGSGVGMRWCQNISLFVEGARRAGRNLTHERWTQAMAGITGFEGTITPTLSFGVGDYSGGILTRTFEVRTDGQCPPEVKSDENDQTCHLIKDDFRPLRRF